jgi:hypothetical protein
MALGRKTGGRQRGTLNKNTTEVRSLAQAYGPAAIAALARLAGLTGGPAAEAETTRVIAIKELLDRGYGRATMPVAGGSGAPLVVEFSWASAPPEPQQSDVPSHTTTGAATAAATYDDPLVVEWETCAPIGASIASHA